MLLQGGIHLTAIYIYIYNIGKEKQKQQQENGAIIHIKGSGYDAHRTRTGYIFARLTAGRWIFWLV